MTNILCILDGWGVSPNNQEDAIFTANTPNYNRILQNYPHTTLRSDGKFVGLPEGQMGNSEVGHMTIGSGRIILQGLPRISKAFDNGDVKSSSMITNLQNNNSNSQIHVIGMLSDGGVHSYQNHIEDMLHILHEQGQNIVLHIFTDGRDTGQKSAKEYIVRLYKNCPFVSIGSIAGRYFGMDRDNRLDRTYLSYNAIVNSQSEYIIENSQESILNFIDNCYSKEVLDEFLPPAIIGDYSGIQNGDSIIMMNFRADRVKQILGMIFGLTDQELLVKYGINLRPIDFAQKIGMTEYSTLLSNYMDILFSNFTIENTLGEVISKKGYKQLRIAETEKYSHVTFFLNGGIDEKNENEDHILIPSPSVATYDLQPEMSALEVTEKILDNYDSYDVIIVNYANADMVGHTGNMEATIKAIETLDYALGKLLDRVIASNGSLMITADHGNAEYMKDENGNPITTHTTYPVPLILCSNSNKSWNFRNDIQGSLAYIAPTFLDMMGIQIPDKMEESLLVK